MFRATVRVDAGPFGFETSPNGRATLGELSRRATRHIKTVVAGDRPESHGGRASGRSSLKIREFLARRPPVASYSAFVDETEKASMATYAIEVPARLRGLNRKPPNAAEELSY